MTKALVDNVIFRTLSQIVVAVIYVLLVRAFTETEFGIYQLFYTVPSFVASVFSLGITVTLSRFLPEYFSRKEFGLARELLSWAKRLRLSTSILILGLFIVFWDSLAPYLKIAEYKNLFYVFTAITVTYFQCRLLSIALSSYLLQQWSMGLAAVFSFVKLVGYSAVLLYDFSLRNALIVDLCAHLLWYASLAWAYRRHVPQHGSTERIPPAERKRLLRFGVFNNFNDVGTLALNTRSDNLFIAAFMDPISVGAYAFCTQLEQMVQKLLPSRFFGAIVHAVVFKLNYVTESQRATQYFTFLTKLNFLCIFPIFVTVAAIPETLITVVFGGKFIEYANLLIIVFAFALISTFQQPVKVMADLGERAGIVLASKIFAVYNVIAIVILIPLMGLIGAAIATGTAIFFKNVFVWYFVRHVASFRGTLRFFAQQFILWAACWLLLRYVDNELTEFLTFVAAVPIVGLSAILSLRLADLTPGDRELIGKFSSGRLHRVLRLAGVSP